MNDKNGQSERSHNRRIVLELAVLFLITLVYTAVLCYYCGERGRLHIEQCRREK